MCWGTESLSDGGWRSAPCSEVLTPCYCTLRPGHSRSYNSGFQCLHSAPILISDSRAVTWQTTFSKKKGITTTAEIPWTDSKQRFVSLRNKPQRGTLWLVWHLRRSSSSSKTVLLVLEDVIEAARSGALCAHLQTHVSIELNHFVKHVLTLTLSHPSTNKGSRPAPHTDKQKVTAISANSPKQNGSYRVEFDRLSRINHCIDS